MTVDTIGNTVGHDAFAGSVIAGKITASANGDSISVGLNLYATGSGYIRVALFSHNSGSNKPDALLGESASVLAAVGWNDLTVTGVSIVAGTIYWIAIQTDAASMYDEGGGGTTRNSYYSKAYDAFAATWPASTERTTYCPNVRMTYAPSTLKEQVHFRWYSNDSAETPTPVGSIDTGIVDVADASVLRLRIAIKATIATWTGKTLKLQFQAGGTGGGWTDVGAAGGAAICRYYNGLGTDKAVVANLLLPDATVKEHFVESAPSQTIADLAANAVGEWDVCIDAHGIVEGTVYYFRIVENDGTVLTTYTMYPSFNTAPTYTDYGTQFQYDPTKYSNPVVYFEAFIKTSGPAFPVYARLYDLNGSAVVANSTVSTTWAAFYLQMRSSALTISAATDLKAQIGGNVGGTASIKGARLIVQAS